MASAQTSGGNTISTSGGLPDRYAAALYAHAADLNQLDAVVEQMEALGRLINDSSDLKRLVRSPLIDVNSAGRAIRAALEAQGFGKTVLDFVIVAFAIFMGVKVINRLKREEAAAPAEPPAPTKEQELLTEIRDLLKNQQKP